MQFEQNMKTRIYSAVRSEIVTFLKDVFSKAGINHGVIAWSGGIDSTVSLYLLSHALPKENITILHLPYTTSYESDFRAIQKELGFKDEQFKVISIQPVVDALCKTQSVSDPLRKGNMMARSRMIILYDVAKELNALVCGTENRTEDLLGYFTRFGDQASDIEPIQHLYKTEVFALAKELGVPDEFITRAPSAGLWSGQTDEGEFGFSYKEADEVLSRYYDDNTAISEMEKDGLMNASKIITLAKKNAFKHEVPYTIA